MNNLYCRKDFLEIPCGHEREVASRLGHTYQAVIARVVEVFCSEQVVAS